MRTYRAVLWGMFLCCGMVRAQVGVYAGGGAGVSTLSADAQSSLGTGTLATSQYKPENGPLASVFAGVHWFEYVSVEGQYVWNSNDVRLVTLAAPGTAYEQARSSRQQAISGNALLYFRNRKSRVRPFLSAGVGAVWLESKATALLSSAGSPVLPPGEFRATNAMFRSAAGVDVGLRAGLRLRYSFTEALSGNEFSRQLQPPGQRGLANFQSLFGLLWEFQRD